MAPEHYKVVIENAILYIRKVKLSSDVLVAHAKMLQQTNAKYLLRRVICKTVTVGQNFYDLTHEKLFSGQLPNIIGMVQNAAFASDRSLNPYNFSILI